MQPLAKAFAAVRNVNANQLVTFKITTRVPTKYRIFDLETGDVWAPDAEGNLTRSADHVILTKSEVEDWRHAVKDATAVMTAVSKASKPR